MSIGMHMADGAAVVGLAHIKQSIVKILTTPIGTRIMRRSFGSMVPDLIDHPAHENTAILLYAATATALYKHEPRFRLTQAQFSLGDTAGAATLTLKGVAALDGATVATSVDVALVAGADHG